MTNLKAGSKAIDPRSSGLSRAVGSESVQADAESMTAITLSLSWAVLDITGLIDKDSSPNFQIPVADDGGSFESVPNHKYEIIVTCYDRRGIKSLALRGSGSFYAQSDPALSEGNPVTVDGAGGSIETQSFTSGASAPTEYQFKVKMSSAVDYFDYSQIPCGSRIASNGTRVELNAVSGVMTFTATAEDMHGHTVEATLDTSPPPA